jgi:hypothetical protein
MKKQIKITEQQLKTLVENNNIIKENEGMKESNYMFFSNLEQIHRQSKLLMELDEQKVNEILNNGHDWADDHITVAKENISQVFDFMMNEFKGSEPHSDEVSNEEIPEETGNKFGVYMNESVEKIKSEFKRFL